MLYCTEGRSLSSLLRETAATEAFTASYSQFPRPEHPVTPHELSLGPVLRFLKNTSSMVLMTYFRCIIDLEMMIG